MIGNINIGNASNAYMQYSVLMSVYYKEKPEFLKESIESMFFQTVLPEEFVLVCDGPLTPELDSVIEKEEAKYKGIIKIVRLEQNSGLGNALNEGLKHCKNNLVARMDSDDISCPDRCEKQLDMFIADPELSLCSGTISEFTENPDNPTGQRSLPLTDKTIRSGSRKRNPINHPCVMFKKDAVLKAGGYLETYHYFEDYYLWVRMFMNGEKAANLSDVLLNMRTPDDIYKRRGGKKYAEEMLRFHKWMRDSGWTDEADYLTGAIPHAAVCIMPNKMRKAVYKALR